MIEYLYFEAQPEWSTTTATNLELVLEQTRNWIQLEKLSVMAKQLDLRRLEKLRTVDLWKVEEMKTLVSWRQGVFLTILMW